MTRVASGGLVDDSSNADLLIRLLLLTTLVGLGLDEVVANLVTILGRIRAALRRRRPFDLGTAVTWPTLGIGPGHLPDRSLRGGRLAFVARTAGENGIEDGRNTLLRVG